MTRADVIQPLDGDLRDTDVLDVRWNLGQEAGAGRAAYLLGHIAGARFLDLDAVLVGPGADPTLGRHPLPGVAQLETGLGKLALDPSRPVVVYDVPGSYAAGRAWWVLTWAGFHVRVLDGGWPAWVASGRAVSDGPVADPVPTTLSLTVGHLPTITACQAAAWPGTLIDARAAERYRGDVEPLDAKAGHIPGAVNRPVTGFWADDGTLRSDDVLCERLGDLRDPVACYCGSGVSAAQIILALAALDVPASLYPPSWSGWSADPTHAVTTGAGEDV
ncbi:MAG: rhodanese-like domain-containing protein [Micrococcales bacterium]|nr:rhodanese-like domain-containing protein [Micrococcales bacterium]